MTEQAGNKISVLPPGHGLRWLVQSLLLVRAQPARLLLLVLLLQLLIGLSRVPVLGILVIIAVPALSAGVLQGFHLAAQGIRPPATLLFAPLTVRPRSGRLMALGAVVLLAGMLTLSLMLAGSETLLDSELMARIEQGDVDALASVDPALFKQFVIAAAAAIGVSGTLSYLAVPLIWFREEKLGTALARGLGALARNWKPFGMLALSLAGMLIPLAAVVGVLFYLAMAAGIFSVVFVALIMICTLIFQLVIFGTQYCAFRDIFELEEANKGDEPRDQPPGGRSDQLLA